LLRSQATRNWTNCAEGERSGNIPSDRLTYSEIILYQQVDLKIWENTN